MTKSYGRKIDTALQQKVGLRHDAVVSAIKQTVPEAISCIVLGKHDDKFAVLVLSQTRVTLMTSFLFAA